MEIIITRLEEEALNWPDSLHVLMCLAMNIRPSLRHQEIMSVPKLLECEPHFQVQNDVLFTSVTSTPNTMFDI